MAPLLCDISLFPAATIGSRPPFHPLNSVHKKREPWGSLNRLYVPGDREYLILLTLSERVTALSVKLVKVLGLDDVDALFDGFGEEGGDAAAIRWVAIGDLVAAAPVVGAEGFFEAVGPDFYTTVGEHFQGNIRIQLLQTGGKLVGIVTTPVYEFVHTFEDLRLVRRARVGPHLDDLCGGEFRLGDLGWLLLTDSP